MRPNSNPRRLPIRNIRSGVKTKIKLVVGYAFLRMPCGLELPNTKTEISVNAFSHERA